MSQNLFNFLQENKEKIEKEMNIAYLELKDTIIEESEEICLKQGVKNCKEQNLIILLIVTLKTMLEKNLMFKILNIKIDLKELFYNCFIVNRLIHDLKGNYNLLTIEELDLKTLKEVEIINNIIDVNKLFIFQRKILKVLIEGLEANIELNIDDFDKAFYRNFDEEIFQDIQASLFLLSKITERLIILSSEDSNTDLNTEEDKTKN